MNQFIGIEGGGTKFICAHGTGPADLKERVVIKTRTPDMTLREIIEYVHSVQKKCSIKAIGLAVFAPIDLDPSSSTYGFITSTPKKGWEYYDIVGVLQDACHLPIGFDTDVNGAALGEHRWGAAREVNNFIYLTVGTGIGGGAMVHGSPVHGAMHPEMGHLIIPQHKDDSFRGNCSYHGYCLEGLASGPAILKRWGVSEPSLLPDEHPAWNLEAYYLGVGLANIIMSYSPEKIILGGGVMQQTGLLTKVHQAVLTALNGYVSCNKIMNNIADYIIKPGLGDDSGISGAIALAQDKSLGLNITSKHFEEV